MTCAETELKSVVTGIYIRGTSVAEYLLQLYQTGASMFLRNNIDTHKSAVSPFMFILKK